MPSYNKVKYECKQSFPSKYLGKNGYITDLTKNMKDLEVEQRKEIGCCLRLHKRI